MRRAVAGAACLAALLATAGCSPLGGGDLEVTVVLDDSAGLFVGNEVGILGVPVGSITAIEPHGKVVHARVELDPGTDVPASAGAVVVSRSVATDRYLELTPAFGDGPRLQDGDRIPLARTRTPVEFDEVLASLDQFSDGLLGEQGDAAALEELLGSGADVLRGRGAELNETVRDLAVAAAGISGHRGDIAGTVRNLDGLTATLADNSDLVDAFIESITAATDLFADEREAFGRSLRALSRALESVAGFVEDNRDLLRAGVPRLTTVLDRILERTDELEETLEVLPLALDNIGRAIGDNDRLDVKIPLTDLSPSHEVTDFVCARLPNDLCQHLGTAPDLDELLDALLGGLL